MASSAAQAQRLAAKAKREQDWQLLNAARSSEDIVERLPRAWVPNADIGVAREQANSIDGLDSLDLVSFDNLPPAPPTTAVTFDGSFSWLPSRKNKAPGNDSSSSSTSSIHAGDEKEEAAEKRAKRPRTLSELMSTVAYVGAADDQDNLQSLVEDAEESGVILPPSYLELMGNPKLQKEIPTCTGCYMVQARSLLRAPKIFGEEAFVVPFLSDQQGIGRWFLLLSQTRPEQEIVIFVLDWEAIEEGAADDDGAGDEENDDDDEDSPRFRALSTTAVCAHSFEAFIYYYYIENSLWFKMQVKKKTLDESCAELTTLERKYIDFYKDRPGNTILSCWSSAGE